MNLRGDDFGTPIALARDSEDRAKSKVCTIAESANRPHRPAIAVTFASRGAGTRWSSSSIDPDYNALVKIGTRQMWAKLACEVPALAGYTCMLYCDSASDSRPR